MKRPGRTAVAIWHEGEPMPTAMVKRFWRTVKKSKDGCWLWLGSQFRAQPGRSPSARHGLFNVCVMSWRGPAWRHEAAHRISYELSIGPIPQHLYVRHRCDNPPCVRPDHLIIGTQADNIADASKRDRIRHGSTHPEAKLTEQSVEAIRHAYAKGDQTEASLASKYDVTWSTISQILRGKTWRRVDGPRTPNGIYPNRKLTATTVSKMRRLNQEGVNITVLAEQFGICRKHAERVVRNNSKFWRGVS